MGNLFFANIIKTIINFRIRYLKTLFAAFSAMISVLCSGISGDISEAVPQTKDTMRIVVNVDTDTAYRVGLEYYLDETPIGSSEAQHADESLITRGEQLTFTFSSKDFPNVQELKEQLTKKMFGVQFVVTDKNGKEISPDFPENWADYLNRDSEIHYRPSNIGTDKPEWVWRAKQDGVYEFVLRESKSIGYYIYPKV